MNQETKEKKPRGFARLSPEERTAMAKKGGSSIPKEKRTFAKNRDLAQNAGRLGGKISGFNRKSRRLRKKVEEL